MSVYQQAVRILFTISCPRTLEACGRLGLDPKQLYYLDINQYKLANPEVFALPKDIQKIRWDHSNKLKQKAIESVIIERRNLINSEYKEIKNKRDFNEYQTNSVGTQQSVTLTNNNSLFRSASQFNKKTGLLGKTMTSSINLKSTALDREMKMLERMKEKQKLEIQSYVENELRSQFMRMENDEKLMMLKQKEEEHKKELAKVNRMKEFERQRRELYRERKLMNDLDENQRQIEEKEYEQQRKFYELQIDDKLKQREIRKKEEESKKRQEELKLNNERIANEEKIKAEERRKKIEQKEQERKMQMEKQRMDKFMEKQKQKLLQQKRLDQTKANTDEKIRRESEQMLRKQMMSEEKRQHFEEMQSLSLKKKNEEALKKQEEIQKTVNRCRELEEMKIYEFNRKMEEMEKQKKIIEKMREEELVQRQIEAKNRELKLIQARQEKERIDNYKKDGVVAKINETDFKIQNLRQVKESELMQKNERNILRRTEKEMNIKRIENMKEYERQKQLEKLDEEYRKSEEFRHQKILIAEKKKEINMQIAIQKKNMVAKLEEYLAKNKEITPLALKELFPGDDKMYERALAIKEQMSSKSQFRSAIKTRDSVSNFKSRDDFNLRTEDGKTKSNYYSTSNLENNKNMSKISKSNITEPNVNYVPKNQFYIENNNENLGDNSANPSSNFPKSGFVPVVGVENLNNENLKVKRSNNNAFNKSQQVSNRKLSEKEIDKLVQEYKTKMNSELLKILQEEKYKDEEREVLYHNTIDIVEKKRLEKIISMERAQSSERILKMNEDIDKKIKEYEDKFKENLDEN